MRVSPEVERQVYSQNGEDGVIEWLLARTGQRSCFAVEIGGGNGIECNTRLLRDAGWRTVLFDDSQLGPGVFQHHVTPENVNDLLRGFDVPKDLDLLSIDVDGMDFWVWEAVDRKYRPRIVVVEYNTTLGPGRSVTVEPDNDRRWDGTAYFGASLEALARLGRRRGYSLVYAEQAGINAFFVRNDLLGDLEPMAPADAIRPHRWGIPPDDRGRPWVEIDSFGKRLTF